MASNSDSSQQDFTHILQKNLDDLRNLVACRICIRPMYEPYTTQCGHTFCYGCLRQWFDRDQTKKTCPDCRAHVLNQPAPAFLVREITQTFVNTAALLPAGETTADHRQPQRDEAELVEKDKSSQVGGGGLFNGRFNSSGVYRAPIRDAADGVDRCPRCTWELEDGLCNSCGYSSFDDFPYPDDQSISTDQSYDSLAIEELLAEDPDHMHFDSDESGSRLRSIRDGLRDQVRHHAQHHADLPFNNRHHRVPSQAHESSNDISTDDDLTDGSGSTGSLRDFVEDNMGIDDNGADSDRSSNLRLQTSAFDSGSEGPWGDGEPSSPQFDDDMNPNPVSIPRQRLRGRRVAMSSPDLEDGDSNTTRSIQPTGQHREDSPMPGGFSPLQSSPRGGRSQDVPIQIDSDSDVPPVRPVGRRRKRPRALTISSDEEDSGPRGVDIPPSRRSRSSRESSERTARNGDHSLAASDSPPPSIVMDTNLSRRNSSSRSLPTDRYSRHRRTPSPPTNTSPISSRNTSPQTSDSRDMLRVNFARMRGRSEQGVPQSGSPSNVQPREERKRMKRQVRARQRQQRALREERTRLNPP
ncbi:MAG: hypothetical protein Q9209_001790 [Squamulea sp. 1 TL-2023]